MEYGTYFLCVALSALAGCAVMALSMKKQGIRPLTGLIVMVGSVVLGVVGARLYYVFNYHILSTGMHGKSLITDQPYEFAMCGAVLAVMLCCVLGAKIGRQSVGKVMDAAAPGAMTALVLARLAEYFADFGWGDVINDPAFQFFPLAVKDVYGDWNTAMNFWEALLALAVLLIFARRTYRRPGVRFALMLLWWAMSQIICESMRIETLRWGFVRVQQLQCAVFGLAVLALAEWWLKDAWALRLRRLGGYLFGVALLVGLEFALDKLSWPQWLDYLLMAAILLGMGTLVHRTLLRADRKAA